MTVRELNLALQGTPESYPHLMVNGSEWPNSPSNNSSANTPNSNHSHQQTNGTTSAMGPNSVNGQTNQKNGAVLNQSGESSRIYSGNMNDDEVVEQGGQSPNSHSNSSFNFQGNFNVPSRPSQPMPPNNFNGQSGYYIPQAQPSPPPQPPQQQYIQQAMPQN